MSPRASALSPVLWTAIVRTSIAPMHEEPRISSPMVSQALAGHRLEIIAESNEWLRARGADAYEGWVHQGYLVRMPGPGARGSRQFPRISLGCRTAIPTGERRSLPLGARLAPEETLISGDAIETSRMARRFPLEPAAIVETAREFFAGTSYLWGGLTPWGADCSGLVSSVFALHGVTMPRDAWMQAEAGTDAGAGEKALLSLAPADLAFFSSDDDGRITHVGIAVGERQMVHLSLARGGYSVEHFDDTTDPYVNRLIQRFVLARRIV